jgi:hypothetical protein
MQAIFHLFPERRRSQGLLDIRFQQGPVAHKP